jgi:hypothetical protein
LNFAPHSAKLNLMATGSPPRTTKRAAALPGAGFYHGVRIPHITAKGRFSREEIDRAVRTAYAKYLEDHGDRT